MAAPCQAWAERYVGRGKNRELFAGNCVLERGHDELDHLPSTLASKQSYDQAFNAGVDAAIAAVLEQDSLDAVEAVAAAVAKVRH